MGFCYWWLFVFSSVHIIHYAVCLWIKAPPCPFLFEPDKTSKSRNVKVLITVPKIHLRDFVMLVKAAIILLSLAAQFRVTLLCKECGLSDESSKEYTTSPKRVT